MALKAILETLDGLADALKGEYTQRDDGKFVLAVEAVNGWALEDVTGLRNTVTATRAERDAAKRELAAWTGTMGELAPDAAIELVKKGQAKKDSTAPPDGKVQERIDAAVAQAQEKYQRELEKERGLREKREAQLQRELVDNTAMRLLPPGTKTKMVLPHIRDHLRPVLDEASGDFVTKVFESKSADQPRMTMESGKTHDMQPEEFIGLLSKDEEWSPAFPGTNATGGGAGGSGGAGSGPTGGKIDPKLPAKERLRLAFQQEDGTG